MTEFQTHYMAAMTERHPFSEIVGKGNVFLVTVFFLLGRIKKDI